MPLRVEVRQSRPNYRVGSANINVNVNDYPINQRQRWASIYLEELFIRTPFQTGRMRESLTVRRVGSTLRGTYRVPYAARVAAIHRAKGNDFVKKAARATGRRIRRGGRRTGRALGETAAGPRAFAATSEELAES